MKREIIRLKARNWEFNRDSALEALHEVVHLRNDRIAAAKVRFQRLEAQHKGQAKINHVLTRRLEDELHDFRTGQMKQIFVKELEELEGKNFNLQEENKRLR